MQYNYQPIKGKNVFREKELAKNDFPLTFFPYFIFIIYSISNKKFTLSCNNLACNWRDLYLFLDSVLFLAKLILLCCLNTSLTIP